MLTDNLVFGRENIAYAVLARHSDAVSEKPIVVSMHLGEKLAMAHLAEMQKRAHGGVQFFVSKIRINGSIEILEKIADRPPQTINHNAPNINVNPNVAPRRAVRITPKKTVTN